MTTKGRNSTIHRALKARSRNSRNSLTGYDMRGRLTSVPTNVKGYAKRNPLKTMGISLLAGVAIAQLLRLVNHK